MHQLSLVMHFSGTTEFSQNKDNLSLKSLNSYLSPSILFRQFANFVLNNEKTLKLRLMSIF